MIRIDVETSRCTRFLRRWDFQLRNLHTLSHTGILVLGLSLTLLASSPVIRTDSSFVRDFVSTYTGVYSIDTSEPEPLVLLLVKSPFDSTIARLGKLEGPEIGGYKGLWIPIKDIQLLQEHPGLVWTFSRIVVSPKPEILTERPGSIALVVELDTSLEGVALDLAIFIGGDSTADSMHAIHRTSHYFTQADSVLVFRDLEPESYECSVELGSHSYSDSLQLHRMNGTRCEKLIVYQILVGPFAPSLVKLQIKPGGVSQFDASPEKERNCRVAWHEGGSR